MAGPYIENYVPAVRLAKGINTKKNVTIGGSANFDASGSTGTFKTSTGATTIGGTLAVTGTQTFTGALAANGGITVPTSKTVAATDSVGLTAGGVILPIYELLSDSQNQVAAASYAVSHTIFVNDNLSGTYKVAAVTATFGTASTSGTLQVEVATGTQAIAAGTNQLTGTVSLAGTANTPVNGTVSGTPTTIAAGSRVNLIFGGTVTNLANCAISVVLQRLS